MIVSALCIRFGGESITKEIVSALLLNLSNAFYGIDVRFRQWGVRKHPLCYSTCAARATQAAGGPELAGGCSTHAVSMRIRRPIVVLRFLSQLLQNFL